MLPKKPTFFSLHPITKVISTAEWLEEARARKTGHKPHEIPCRLHQEAVPQVAWDTFPTDPSTDPGAPQVLYVSDPLPPQDWLLKCTPSESKWSISCRQLTQHWDWERHTNLNISGSFPREKRDSWHPTWLCSIKKRHTILRIRIQHTPTPEEETRVWSVHSHRKGLWEPQNHQLGWLVKPFLSWSQSAKTGGGDPFFKCEDSNTRLQGTQKFKDTYHH